MKQMLQLGLLMAPPMVMEIGLERRFRAALGKPNLSSRYYVAVKEAFNKTLLIIMQLLLYFVFFTFSLGTKSHYFGRTVLHGVANYRATKRGFVVRHVKFGENYRMYSRSHFTKGLELMLLLIVYQIYGSATTSATFMLLTAFMWFLVATWLFAPFLFNPSCFEWQNIVDDLDDWSLWINNHRGGSGSIDRPAEYKWEFWWKEEQQHLSSTGSIGLFLEIILSLRFFAFQYVIVYHLHVSNCNRILIVFAHSWLVVVAVIPILKVVSIGQKKFGFFRVRRWFRLLELTLCLGFGVTLMILYTLNLSLNLTLADIGVSFLAFMPTVWGILQISQALKPVVKAFGLWGSVNALACWFENVMGMVIFTPVKVLSLFPFVSKLQTRLLFNQADLISQMFSSIPVDGTNDS